MFTCKASLASGEKWNTISHTLKDASNLHTNGNYAFRKLGHANLNNSYYLNWRVYSLIYIHRVYCTKNEERILNYEHNEISQIDEYWWIQARTNSGKLLHWSTHTHTHTHRGKQTALSQLQKRLNQCHVQTQVILTDMDQSVVWAVW